MEFIAGDPRAIGAAVESGDDLRNFVGHVDFSLHLTQEALDALIEEVCARKELPATTFDEVLTEKLVGDDGADFGADVVSPAMVETLANLNEFDLRAITRTWSESLGTTPTPELVDALSGLRDLCATARSRSVAVVFAWSL